MRRRPSLSTLLAATLAAVAVAAPAAASAAEPPASVTLDGTLRDFRGYDITARGALPRGHIDFENASAAEMGIVGLAYGALADGKPVYAKEGVSSATTHGRAAFDQWFRDTPGVNLAEPLSLTLARQPNGTYRYQEPAFYPADGSGWVARGDEPTRDDATGRPHNFSFTTELHSELLYSGAETISITGEDDVFLYVNGRLALDLGGVHGAMGGSAVLAAAAGRLGLTAGRLVDVDLFVAERHSNSSSLSVITPQLGFDAGSASLPASARSGETVTCAAAGWPADVTLTYAWSRDGAEIAGANDSSYVVVAADAGRALTCEVTGSRRTSASATSDALAVAPPEIEDPPYRTPPQPDPPVPPSLDAPVLPLPAPADGVKPLPPRMTLHGATLMAARNGTVLLRLTCSPREGEGRGTCRGSVRLSHTARATRRARARTSTLARASFSAPAGRVATVRLRLTRAARRLLAQAPGRRVKVRVVVDARDLAGNSGRLSVPRTLRLR